MSITAVIPPLTSCEMSMTGALDRLCSNYDSGEATVSNGENDEDLSLVLTVTP